MKGIRDEMKTATGLPVSLTNFSIPSTPFTILWLIGLAITGIFLFWLRDPFSVGRGRPKGEIADQNHEITDSPIDPSAEFDTSDFPESNETASTTSDEEEVSDTDNDEYSGLSNRISTSQSQHQNILLLPSKLIYAKSKSTTLVAEVIIAQPDNNKNTTSVQDAADSSETLNVSLNDDTSFEENSDKNLRLKIDSPLDFDNEKAFTMAKSNGNILLTPNLNVISTKEDSLIPTFNDYLFDLRSSLPLKISVIRSMGFYIKWSNGTPTFCLKEPFDPVHWIYSEPQSLPVYPNSLSLDENFPRSNDDHYNYLTSLIRYMNQEELIKLGRSLHLGSYCCQNIELLRYRIRKTLELQIDAMASRKAAMAGWVTNYRSYQQLYPVHNKGWYAYVVVIDFECTCEGNSPDFQNEIIQFPAVLIDTNTREIVDEFNVYVKPTENPKLTDFCKNLTGITQESVNAAPTFPEALNLFSDWLKSHRLTDKNFTIVTDGPTDMGKFLLEQCEISGIEYPSFAKRWINIRKVFSSFYGIRWYNLKIMMDIIGMPFKGCHHNGADDARNIATIYIRLLHDGCLAFQNEQVVLDKSLQSSYPSNRSFYLNSVVPYNNNYYYYNPKNCLPEDLSHNGCPQVKKYGTAFFFLPESFSTLGNKENAAMPASANGNSESVTKRERKLFNVVMNSTESDMGSTK